MTDHQLAAILHQLRRAAAVDAGIGDAELLQRFVAHRDEVSFELLMWRHAQLVWNVCRRVLQNGHDAEDAFQVTFLALARQAARIKNRACLAGWLYQVAYRAALAARARRVKRRESPQDVHELRVMTNGERGLSEEDHDALDQEIHRLPERFQIPVVLCYLEGKSVSETALLLGWPRGTVASRLSRARQRLRARLARRGLEFTADLPTPTQDGGGSPALTVAIPVLAKQILAGAAADSVLAPQVASLTKEVMKAMFLSKLKTQAILVVTVLGLILAGGGWAIHLYAVSPEGPHRKDADEPQTKKADEPTKPKPPPHAGPKTVTVVQPIRREAAPYADYPGRLVALRQVDVQPTVSGRLEKVLFQAGADVKKGDLLFEIDPTSYKLAVLKVAAQLSRLKDEVSEKNKALQRGKELEKTGAIGQEVLDDLASRASAAEAALRPAQVELEQAELKLQATRITAPLDGRISEPRVYPGNQVYPGGDKTIVLATITVLDPIGLSFNMDERSYLRYQHLLREKEVKGTGSPLSMGVSDESGFPREGTLVGFGDRIEETFGTIRARAKFRNPDGLLLPGMFARVRVTFGKPRTVLEVPRKAVWGDEKTHESYVLIVNDRKQVEQRTVQTESLEMAKGPAFFPNVEGADDKKAFIKEGLGVDDWVIISNIQGLQPGDEVEVKRVKNDSKK
jgi:RND family efflux transporter MFP subunit